MVALFVFFFNWGMFNNNEKKKGWFLFLGKTKSKKIEFWENENNLATLAWNLIGGSFFDRFWSSIQSLNRVLSIIPRKLNREQPIGWAETSSQWASSEVGRESFVRSWKTMSCHWWLNPFPPFWVVKTGSQWAFRKRIPLCSVGGDRKKKRRERNWETR